MEELSAKSETLPPTQLLSVVSSQGFSTEHSWDEDSFCWSWCNQEGEMLILSLNADVPSPLGGWTDTQLIGLQIHNKEFESSSYKHTKLPSETTVGVLQGCKAHILPANVVQAS